MSVSVFVMGVVQRGRVGYWLFGHRFTSLAVVKILFNCTRLVSLGRQDDEGKWDGFMFWALLCSKSSSCELRFFICVIMEWY